MAEHAERQKKSSEQDSEPRTEQPAGDGQAQSVSEETSDLLDEIDDVLEEHAEEFVANYQQKGGE